MEIVDAFQLEMNITSPLSVIVLQRGYRIFLFFEYVINGSRNGQS